MSTMIEDAKDEAESGGLISQEEKLMLEAVYKAVGIEEQDKLM
jgi:tellurite resistance protein